MACIPLLDRQVRLDLTGHVTTQVHIAKSFTLVGEVQNNCAGEFVVGGAGAVGSFENVNTIPFARALGTGGDTCEEEGASQPGFIVGALTSGEGLFLTLLQENNAGKSIIQVPKVDTSDSALVVQLAVNIKGFVRRNLELANLLTGNSSILQRGVKFIAPW